MRVAVLTERRNGETRVAATPETVKKYIGMGPCELHNPNYDFNDALLPIGSSYWVKLVGAFFGR